MDIRLLLVSHASTAAMRAGRFSADESLDERGLAEATAARERLSIARDATAFVSPAPCARETASALGLAATVAPELADIDYGQWHGRRLADLAVEAPQDLAAWTRDPDALVHDGESFSQLVKRIGRWLDGPGDARNVVGVTHAPVIRAAIVHALGASPAVFPRIEIAPLSVVELRRSQRGWAWWPTRQ